MLVGVGGSGRSSVAKLATHMSKNAEGDDYTLFGIEVGRGYGLQQFRDDIKELLFKCANGASYSSRGAHARHLL